MRKRAKSRYRLHFALAGALLALLGFASAMPPAAPLPTTNEDIIRKACVEGRGIYGLPQFHQHNRCIRKSVRLLAEGQPLLRAGYQCCDEFAWNHNRLWCFESLLSQSPDPEAQSLLAHCQTSPKTDVRAECMELFLKRQ